MTTREKLDALASNLWWSWNPGALDLFRRLNPDVFQAASNNPVAAFQAADDAVIADKEFAGQVDAVYEVFRAYMDRPWAEDAPRTTYFCMEYGLHESLPLYAGGLGILAGDHTKAASDVGLPFTAIGLFLRDGYFKQHFDEHGWQTETYPDLDPDQHPLTLVTKKNGTPLTVKVVLAHQPLVLQAWRVDIGRTTLYLLDSDRPDNPPELRSLTRRLYQNGRAVRIQQEIILGIGGIRLLRALGVETDVYHMNEGHCAFLTLELLRERLVSSNALADDSLTSAENWVRERCVFTTHTPVMAGHDRFDPALFLEQMDGFRAQLGFSAHDLLSYGRVNPNDVEEWFTMTVLALKLSRTANGVSALHGEVARRQWHHLYPDLPVAQVPIGHITNGIHLPTWTAPHAQRFLEEQLGDWLHHRNDPGFWEQMDNVSDEALWAYRNTLRHTLVEFVRAHVATQSLEMPVELDPDALTIGFARRFAPYKRASLIFQELERAVRLFSQPGRPIQILFAGKAHPANAEGKGLIQQLYQSSLHTAMQGKVLILENYSIEIGRMLVSGCDVWLNNPRRPYEASGTSGQKAPVHGGLNVSILDGWWPEGFNGHNGWAIGHEASADYKDPVEQDAEDVRFLMDVLEGEVVPAFYERDDHGLPRQWIGRMRNAIKTLPTAFSAERMVRDYIDQMYRPTTTVPA